MKDVERLIGKAIERVEIDGYTPKVEKAQRGARKTKDVKKKTDGAFGKKRETKVVHQKKRKVTKRDAFKAYDAAKPKKEDVKKKKKKDNKRGKR